MSDKKETVRLTIPFIQFLTNQSRPVRAFMTLGFLTDSNKAEIKFCLSIGRLQAKGKTYTINRLSVTLSASFSSSDKSIHSSLLSLALRSLGGVKLWPTIVP